MYLIKGLVYVTFLSVRGRNRNSGWKLSGKQLAWKPTYQHWNWPAMRTPNLTAALGHVTCSGFRWHPWWWVSLLSLQGTDMETVVQHSSEMCIPKHLSCHKDLDPFSELMKWLKEVDHTVFEELCQVLIQYSYPQIHLTSRQISIAAPNKAATNRTCTRLGICCKDGTGILGSWVSSAWKGLCFLTDNIVLEDLNSV